MPITKGWNNAVRLSRQVRHGRACRGDAEPAADALPIGLGEHDIRFLGRHGSLLAAHLFTIATAAKPQLRSHTVKTAIQPSTNRFLIAPCTLPTSTNSGSSRIPVTSAHQFQGARPFHRANPAGNIAKQATMSSGGKLQFTREKAAVVEARLGTR